MDKPILAITMGDPAGIGPEITLKALARQDVYARCRPLVIGDAGVMREAVRLLGSRVRINPIHAVSEAKLACGTADVLDMGLVDTVRLERGKVSAMAGEAAFQYVVKAIELAKAGEVDATVTNAINKEAMNLAGHRFAGHTEIYAEYTGSKRYTMMLAHENLRVVHVSTHVSLREACDRVKADRVLEVIGIADRACRGFGITAPRIAVAGLNPHAGENGLFGREEIEEIIPAIKQARREGIDASGPLPPDTVFAKARGGFFDAVVAMYHDQGHIPLKMAGFVFNEAGNKWESVSGVNITLGLPIIRTSVDHGTAFDLAGKGVASEASLLSAIDYAILMAKEKR